MPEDTDLEFEKFKMYKNIAYAIVSSSILILAFVVYFIRSDLTNILSNSIINLLSFALAFFAIILSAMFYFESVKTSNKFYNDVNSFIRDMHEKIGRMEERFGKDLEYLGKIQSDMNGLLSDKTKKLNDAKQSETELKYKLEKTDDKVEKEKLRQELELKEREKQDLKCEVQKLNEINSELKSNRNKLAHPIPTAKPIYRNYGVYIPFNDNLSMDRKKLVGKIRNTISKLPVKQVSYSYDSIYPKNVRYGLDSILDPDSLNEVLKNAFEDANLENEIDIANIKIETHTII
ncbi:hypothetical protein [Methanococcus maripaludis]|uniref:Uncharacterized protein n=1 Tax=Methanococcus maripaludis TaxID=39152 RepID=A0A7J9PW89_METMI|nr:hypothetical protein [Methanococcus maripaludis]MBA2868950.1 hypothetical protein [Methanococcus maripaludis]